MNHGQKDKSVRILLALAAIIIAAFPSFADAQSEGARYKILRADENGATLIDTRSTSKGFAGKYVSVWLILLSKDLSTTEIDYFQSRVRFDCGARTSRRDMLLAIRQGESTIVGKPELLDSEVMPESSSELAFEYACKGVVSPDVADLSLLSLAEVVELNAILHAASGLEANGP